jgi:dihydrofolate synthase / folylpolyglutamate synthase
MCEISERLDDFFSSYMPSLSGSLRGNRLGRMNLLLERLGHPERSFRTIHIAGSKGKGTTATCLSYMLSTLGFRTGLFLSPHVYDIRERFTLSSSFFTDEEYVSALESLKRRIEGFELPSSLGCPLPTTFELYTAYAYLLFSRTGCQWAVIETGLGGRLDATNTIESDAAVITHIELEHTQILGSTLPLIAREKAGIIRKEKPVFVLRQSDEVLDVFRETAASLSSELSVFEMPPLDIDDGYRVREMEYLGAELKMKTWKSDIRLTDAFFAIFILSKMNLLHSGTVFDLTGPDFHLPGRFEEREVDGRTLLLDGAHTVNSVEYLASALSQSPFSSRTLIFSTAQDKNWRNMLSVLVPLFDCVIVTSTGSWKKSYPEKIYKDAVEMFPERKIEIILNHEDVINRALALTEEGGLITATGSFYLLGELDSALRGKKWH